ncbi:bifunctional phosphoribosylaminoimidazolecarboxamide formyltransferase/IMP cyclohydrolase [Hippea maritima]|uniref:Bifunctional purine biosynthesis protein PurH n=1 Tax=Hippea maritima (strain ATCC 700847 / DSM 10411 / MH2) TaxID=760142 RepID=F2LW90_HIPMA|nr:bifunctional phosphoribosylaminoimidazolecarboxamide formyltransferase/IMP cyclohydrolase [Hippea maritima]AEA34024.1 Bifunctional purine biosynthesis protein purH [Hippea maritima DSM 10411]
MKKAALISVSDKKGIVEFARFLQNKGFLILSTGSTGKLLKDNGIDVEFVEDYTQAKEMLDGRVKTLHPKVHGGILYRRDIQEHRQTVNELDIYSIDVVVVNLYPFEETALKTNNEEDLIENIDIGGPTLIRAAAKNYKDVLIICDPDDYKTVMENFDSIDKDKRREYALKAFAKTSYYDGLIVEKMSGNLSFKETAIPFKIEKQLRYGENPHQLAFFAKSPLKDGISNLIQLNGKELSYNNLLDIDVVYRMMVEFDQTICVIVKHNTPCGAATSNNQLKAYEDALACDPVSAFGGIIGINSTLNKETAEAIIKRFYEVVVAFDFDKDALEVLKSKKNLRVIKLPKVNYKFYEIKSLLGGYLIQENDYKNDFTYEVVSKAKPNPQQLKDLEFAFKVAKFVKSNAIVYAKDGKTLAIGGGQTSRVDSAKFAIARAKELNIDLNGCVMASDGFFPFRDSVDEAAKAGVKAIVEPGGSIRDKEVIEAADEYNIPLLFTRIRHFRH